MKAPWKKLTALGLALAVLGAWQSREASPRPAPGSPPPPAPNAAAAPPSTPEAAPGASVYVAGTPTPGPARKRRWPYAALIGAVLVVFRWWAPGQLSRHLDPAATAGSTSPAPLSPMRSLSSAERLLERARSLQP